MKYIPNAFQVANAFVDEMMADLSGSAIKCYLKIVRQTTGWGKEMDHIPISQFQTACGLKKRDTVGHALNELEQAGLIERVERLGCVTGYRLKGVEPTPKNGVTTHPENGGNPNKRGNPENGGGVTPKNGVTTHPEKRGTSKPNTKPTNTKPKDISAHAGASAPDAPTLPDQPNTLTDGWDSNGPEPPAKPKKRQPSAAQLELTAYHLLADKGVDGQLAADYMALRKSKRAGPLTQTALAGLEREANLAGLSLTQAVTVCCERSWVGFKAEWFFRDSEPRTSPAAGKPRQNAINRVPQHTNGGAHLAKDIL
ncbi:replication protein [Neisseria shayeganii]|uniref:Replication protein n=1 Tax=Neisseria shayeganii TaxID=607712 RepID=A0A7D7N4F7_9NEIS|nr:replication protein [Neisseria shayeganii]QMT41265.1 replication protein [Neisseria shayeganii]